MSYLMLILTQFTFIVGIDALMGIKDLFLKHPDELRLHMYAVIEKLRERIGDDDKLVREALYQLFKSVIFPSCKEVGCEFPCIILMFAA